MAIAAVRFNNPGNVSLPIQGIGLGGGQIVGITGQPGYGSFPDMATGYSAFQQRITTYLSRPGLDTISGLGGIYAEGPNGGSVWANSVSNFSGIDPNTPLDPNNPQQMAALQGGIIRQETGMTPAQLGIDTSNGLSPSTGTLGGDLTSGSYDPPLDSAEAYTVDPVWGTPTGTIPSSDPVADAYQPSGEPDNTVADLMTNPTGPTTNATFDQATAPVAPSVNPNAQDVPTAIDQQTQEQALAAGVQAQAIAASATTQATTNAQIAQAQTQTETTWLGQIESWFGNLFVRGGVILAGAICLAVGLWMLGRKLDVQIVKPL